MQSPRGSDADATCSSSRTIVMPAPIAALTVSPIDQAYSSIDHGRSASGFA
ncbi:MAG: hypothetical protein IPO93_14085 [Actinobacteria bacterium]|nr:hypothetical protein [Actinomycetota bacterium]